MTKSEKYDGLKLTLFMLLVGVWLTAMVSGTFPEQTAPVRAYVAEGIVNATYTVTSLFSSDSPGVKLAKAHIRDNIVDEFKITELTFHKATEVRDEIHYDFNVKGVQDGDRLSGCWEVYIGRRLKEGTDTFESYVSSFDADTSSCPDNSCGRPGPICQRHFDLRYYGVLNSDGTPGPNYNNPRYESLRGGD